MLHTNYLTCVIDKFVIKRDAEITLNVSAGKTC